MDELQELEGELSQWVLKKNVSFFDRLPSIHAYAAIRQAMALEALVEYERAKMFPHLVASKPKE